MKIIRGWALDNTPSRATAPAGGCQNRKFCPITIGEVTATPLKKGEVQKKQQKLLPKQLLGDF